MNPSSEGSEALRLRDMKLCLPFAGLARLVGGMAHHETLIVGFGSMRRPVGEVAAAQPSCASLLSDVQGIDD